MMKILHRIAYVSFLALAVASLQSVAVADDVKKDFTVRKGGTLSLELEAEVIQIMTSEGTTVTVSAEDIRSRDMDELEIKQVGDDVFVEFKPGRRNQDARFYFTIPVEYNVEVEYSGGRFEIGDLLKGTLDLETGGGNVDIGTITGTTTIKTGGGNVEAKDLGSDVSVRTGGGNLEIDRIGGRAGITSGGGNIRLKDIAKDLDLTTGGGNVRVGDVKGLAEITTGGGNVDLGPVSGVISLRTGGGNVDAKGGNGKNKVKTGGGNVDLERMSGSIDLQTGGGDVSVELDPTGKDDSNVHSRGGDVTLIVPASAKATIEAVLNIHRGDPDEYKISTDFKADTMEVDEDGNAEAIITLNGGGQHISVETTDGDIRIRRQ